MNFKIGGFAEIELKIYKFKRFYFVLFLFIMSTAACEDNSDYKLVFTCPAKLS